MTMDAVDEGKDTDFCPDAVWLDCVFVQNGEPDTLLFGSNAVGMAKGLLESRVEQDAEEDGSGNSVCDNGVVLSNVETGGLLDPGNGVGDAKMLMFNEVKFAVQPGALLLDEKLPPTLTFESLDFVINCVILL